MDIPTFAPKLDKNLSPADRILLIEEIRQRRVPFNGKDRKLEVHSLANLAGWHLHWFNDLEGRVERAVQAGYQFVERSEVELNPGPTPANNDPGDRVRRAVGTDGSGNALYCYLMKLPEELWQEDQKDAQSRVDAIDAAIQQGVSDTAFKDSEAKKTAYSPPGVITRKTDFSKLSRR